MTTNVDGRTPDQSLILCLGQTARMGCPASGKFVQTCLMATKVQGHPTRIPGKYLLLNHLIPGWLAKLDKFKILAGKLKI